MAYTVDDALLLLARRLGENSSPTAANEKGRRISYLASGYRNLVGSTLYWFCEESATISSVADKEYYTVSDGFPSDFREMIEVRIDDLVYTPIDKSKVFGLYNSSINILNYSNILTNKHYYVFDSSLYILPKTPTTDTDNIKIKYYKYPNNISSSTDTFVLPDFYIDGVVAYAYGRMGQMDGDRAQASDGFTEFEEVKKSLNAENNRHKFYNKSSRPIDPSLIVD